MYDKYTSTMKSTADDGTKVRILVVDDDLTCLAVIAAMLKSFNYQVATTSNPLEALSTLRMNPDYFDLVLTDVHMPYMSGLELHKIVDQEFHIPVILMSADDKRSLVYEGLSNGAAFFIVKPPTPNDLKNLWQYVVSRTKGKDNTSLDKNHGILRSSSIGVDQYRHSTLSLSGERPVLNYPKRKVMGLDQDGEERIDDRSFLANRKKPKLIWTTSLHNKFLEAIRVIGPNRAVPKKILEYMNIPGLTRENIASHLQKYRIYLRRICESSGSMHNGMPQNWNEIPYRSSFSWSQFPTLANNNGFMLNYPNNNTRRPNNNNNVTLANPNPFGGCDQVQGQGFLNHPNNYNFAHQHQPIMGTDSNSAGANPGFGSTFMGGEISILESSMLVGQTNIHTNINTHNTGNVQPGELQNQGDLGNAAVQFFSSRPNMSDLYHREQTSMSMTQMGSVVGGEVSAGLCASLPNNAMISNGINSNGVIQQGNQQGTFPVIGQNDPRQEMPNLDVSTVGSPFQLQDWASKNLDEFSLDGIEDLAAFLSSYDANNGTNNQLP